MTTYLMVHGGGHGAWCWSPLLSWLDDPMLAVDLPGRGRQVAVLEEQTYSSFATSVESQIITRNLHDLVVVAHSMGGITAIGLMSRVAARIRHVVFVASPIPAEGESIPDLMRRRKIELLRSRIARLRSSLASRIQASKNCYSTTLTMWIFNSAWRG